MLFPELEPGDLFEHRRKSYLRLNEKSRVFANNGAIPLAVSLHTGQFAFTAIDYYASCAYPRTKVTLIRKHG